MTITATTQGRARARPHLRHPDARGITLLEVLIYIAVLSLIVIGFTDTAIQRSIRADYDIALADALIVATRADVYRQQVIVSNNPPTAADPWTYEFNDIVGTITAADLAELMDEGFATTTPWGTPFSVRASPNASIVEYTVPADILAGRTGSPVGGRLTILPSGDAEVVVMPLKRPLSNAIHRGYTIKRRAYLEDFRS